MKGGLRKVQQSSTALLLCARCQSLSQPLVLSAYAGSPGCTARALNSHVFVRTMVSYTPGKWYGMSEGRKTCHCNFKVLACVSIAGMKTGNEAQGTLRMVIPAPGKILYPDRAAYAPLLTHCSFSTVNALRPFELILVYASVLGERLTEAKFWSAPECWGAATCSI